MKSWMTTDNVKIGQLVWIAEVLNTSRAHEETIAFLTPRSKNLSGEKVLRDWCGETNNINVSAIGCGVVTKLSKSSEYRALVEILPDDDARVIAACDEHGIA